MCHHGPRLLFVGVLWEDIETTSSTGTGTVGPCVHVCVFITAGPITKLFAARRGRRRVEDMCYVCVYYCRTYDKAVCGEGGGQ